MIERIDRLGEFSLFTGPDPHVLAEVAKIATVEEFSAVTRLTEQGGEADRFHCCCRQATAKVGSAGDLEGVLNEVSPVTASGDRLRVASLGQRSAEMREREAGV